MPVNPNQSTQTNIDELLGFQTRSTIYRAGQPLPTTERNDSPADRLYFRSSSRPGGGGGGGENNNIPPMADDPLSQYNDLTTILNRGYNWNMRVFPENLGSEGYNHYMVINVNVQTDADNNARGRTLNNATGTFQSSLLVGERSRVDTLNNTQRGFVDNAGSALNDFANFTVPRGTTRIAESIALFMPTPMIYSNQHVFEEISLTAFGAQALKLGATTIGRLISGLQGRSASQALNNSNINILGPAGNLIRKGMALAGTPINPKLEVLYSHTPQRSFVMEMLFAPKNQKESDTMKKIIDTLRYHAAPEIDGLGGGQFFEGGGPIPVFIPPSEFDITFYYRGQENTRIPRINTCVLERIEVDYAPSGVYSTFSNGHPVAARLSLSFRELEILHKKRVTQGF